MSHGPQRIGAQAAIQYLEGDLIEHKYRLLRPIGGGGMGVVWAAYNVALDVEVALKLIHQDEFDAEALSTRFLQEARTAAQLAHPAICRVFDYGKTHAGDPFIVCELLSGETLRSHLEKHGQLEATQAIRTILPVVDGLSVAHAIGVVHRDVKSNNIFLAKDAVGRIQPKLLDFCVSRSILTCDGGSLATTLVGTPKYMSPEQAKGDTDCDFRTDVWSLCVVLYELMTGVAPFDAQSDGATLALIVNEAPKSLLEWGIGDPALWQILEKGLKKDASERWSSMRELGSALARWLADRGLSEDRCGASLRATWLDPNRARPSLANIASSSLPLLGSTTLRASIGSGARAAHSFDCTLPGVAKTASRATSRRRMTPYALGALGLCLAMFTTWLLWSSLQPSREASLMSASTRHATTGVAVASPPIVDLETLDVESRSDDGRGAPDANEGRASRADAGAGPGLRNGRATDKAVRHPRTSPGRKSTGGVDFGF